MTYVYLMNNEKPLNEELIKSHVGHLKELKKQGKLVFCGPFTDYPGGMVIFLAESLEEATNIAKSDPFIASGYKSFEIRTLEPANEENNYLLEE
ncbi:YciI family protein [Konateibacter massiliensis]|uniref:YciI family protein n=1 Tax=Konateibacter massiliensis TaxID=2002841 RepID=UPI000C15B0C4|nr:YciI family protein [Konateibacter massiliensis]